MGLTLLTAALVCGELAQAHMRRLATICGLEDAHCGWCYAAAMLSAAAGAALALAILSSTGPTFRRAKVKAP